MSQHNDVPRLIQIAWPIAVVVCALAVSYGGDTAELSITQSKVETNTDAIREVSYQANDLDKRTALNEQALNNMKLSIGEIKEDTKTILTMLQERDK